MMRTKAWETRNIDVKVTDVLAAPWKGGTGVTGGERSWKLPGTRLVFQYWRLNIQKLTINLLLDTVKKIQLVSRPTVFFFFFLLNFSRVFQAVWTLTVCLYQTAFLNNSNHFQEVRVSLFYVQVCGFFTLQVFWKSSQASKRLNKTEKGQKNKTNKKKHTYLNSWGYFWVLKRTCWHYVPV